MNGNKNNTAKTQSDKTNLLGGVSKNIVLTKEERFTLVNKIQ
jgi:hypothetical protein